LVKTGLDQAEALGARAAVVLGDPAYYGRFGFVPAGLFGLEWDRPCPPGAFQVTALAERALAGLDGVVRYHAAFGAV
ncbi:N-acetyltransferase, partial [Acinetobacter baumannii]